MGAIVTADGSSPPATFIFAYGAANRPVLNYPGHAYGDSGHTSQYIVGSPPFLAVPSPSPFNADQESFGSTHKVAVEVSFSGFSEKEVTQNTNVQYAIKKSMEASLQNVMPDQVNIIAINDKPIEKDIKGRRERIRRLTSAVRLSFEIV